MNPHIFWALFSWGETEYWASKECGSDTGRETILGPVRIKWCSLNLLYLSVCLSVSVRQDPETSSAPHASQHLITAPAVPPPLYYSSDPTWNSTAVAVHLLKSGLLFLSVCEWHTHVGGGVSHPFKYTRQDSLIYSGLSSDLLSITGICFWCLFCPKSPSAKHTFSIMKNDIPSLWCPWCIFVI